MLFVVVCENGDDMFASYVFHKVLIVNAENIENLRKMILKLDDKNHDLKYSYGIITSSESVSCPVLHELNI